MPTSQPFLPPGPLVEHHLEHGLLDGIGDAALVGALGQLWSPQVTAVPGAGAGHARAHAGRPRARRPGGPATQRVLWVWLHRPPDVRCSAARAANAALAVARATGVTFVGFGADPTIVLEMLERMCGLGDPPVADRLIDYATADSGSMDFVPSIEALSGIGVSPPEPA